MTQTNKQQTIQYLTELMATIQAAYFKGRMEGHTLWVHESMGDSAAISIDLYNFGADGKPVCEGLYPCTITHDDGTSEKGHVFCMCYDPDAVTPLTFLFSYAEWSDKSDIEIEPSVMPTKALQNIATWLEQAMQPVPKKEEKIMLLCSYDEDERDHGALLAVSRERFKNDPDAVRKAIAEHFEPANDEDVQELKECIDDLMQEQSGYYGSEYYWKELQVLL